MVYGFWGWWISNQERWSTSRKQHLFGWVKAYLSWMGLITVDVLKAAKGLWHHLGLDTGLVGQIQQTDHQGFDPHGIICTRCKIIGVSSWSYALDPKTSVTRTYYDFQRDLDTRQIRTRWYSKWLPHPCSHHPQKKQNRKRDGRPGT